jgi:hypothetical protein
MRRPRVARDAAIAIGAGIAAAGFVVGGVAVLTFLISEIRIGYAPTSYEIGKGVDVGHDVLLAAAFAIVAAAAAGRIDRREHRFALAAMVAALAFAAWTASQALYGVSEPRGFDPQVTVDALEALAASALAAASVLAAVAFRRGESCQAQDLSRRDGLLTWAAVGLGVSLALSTASGIVSLVNIELVGIGNDGFRLSTAGVATGIVGAVFAAIGFLVSRRGQEQGGSRWMSRREAFIALALAAFLIGFALTGIGDATTASATARDDLAPDLVTTSYWLEAVSAWALAAGAAVVAAGFFISSRSTRSSTSN